MLQTIMLKMQTVDLVLLIFISVSLGLGCKKSNKHSEPPIKNILLLLADDMGGHIGVMGEQNVSTPTLDSLADKGMLFSEAHATQASCSPSRSSLLTGMHPHSNGHWRNTVTPKITEPEVQFTRASTKLDKVGIHEDITTLPELLNREGFYTGITQKWHLSPPWKFPFKRRLAAKGSLHSIREDLNTFFNEVNDRPFFLQMNIGNTHRPFKEGMEYAKRVNPASIKVPSIFPDTPKARQDLANYYTMVNGVDQVVQTTLNVLKEAGVEEETLIIFSSDHGWPYPRAKATAYYMGTHVPLIISGPSIQKHQRSDTLVSLTDIMPTILDYLNIAIPQTVQGRSLKPLLEGRESSNWRSVLFTEHNSHGPPKSDWYPSRAAFDGKYQYIRNLWPDKTYQFPADLTEEGPPWYNLIYPAVMEAKEQYRQAFEAIQNTKHRPEEELYNVQKDPYEMNNLADDPGYELEKNRLKGSLNQWMEKTNDPFNPAKITRRKSSE